MTMFAAQALFVLAVAALTLPASDEAMADGTHDAISAYRRCVMTIWQPPALALGRSDLTVKIHIFRSARGTIRKTEVADKGRLKDDALFRATAESAMRAALNMRCGNALPRPAPRGIILILDPSELTR